MIRCLAIRFLYEHWLYLTQPWNSTFWFITKQTTKTYRKQTMNRPNRRIHAIYVVLPMPLNRFRFSILCLDIVRKKEENKKGKYKEKAPNKTGKNMKEEEKKQGKSRVKQRPKKKLEYFICRKEHCAPSKALRKKVQQEQGEEDEKDASMALDVKAFHMYEGNAASSRGFRNTEMLLDIKADSSIMRPKLLLIYVATLHS